MRLAPATEDAGPRSFVSRAFLRTGKHAALAGVLLAMGLTLCAAQAQASDQVLTWFGNQAGSGALGGQLNHPGAIAVNNTGAGPASPGETYLPDEANNRIQRFDKEGNFISAWGAGVISGGTAYEICTTAASCQAGTAAGGNGAASGNGDLDHPTSVAIDQDTGDAYVSDRENNRIDVYSGDGTFLRAFGFDVVDPASPFDNTGTGFEVCNVAEHPTDVCKAGSAAATPATGQYSSVAAPGGYGLALSAPDGNPATGTVYLANSGAHRIESFHLDGTSPAKIGAANFEAGQPRKLTLDSRGILYASNSKAGGEVERYDSTGANGPIGFLAPIAAAANEIQRVTFTSFAEGDTFTLTCPGGESVGIEYSDVPANRASQIANSLQAKCDGGNFTVSEAPAPTVTFGGSFAGTDVPQMTCTPIVSSGTCKATTVLNGHSGLLPGEAETATAGLAVHLDSDGAGPDSDVLYVLRDPSSGPTVVQQFGPTNQPGLAAAPTAADDVHGAGAGFGEVFDLGLDDPDSHLLVSAPSLGSVAAERVWVLGSPPQPPGVSVGAPTAPLDLTGTTATLRGTVTTDKIAAGYHFEYSSDGGTTWTRVPGEDPEHPDQDTELPGDGAAHQVSAQVSGLEAHTTYQLRLVATKALGGGSAEAQTSFQTPGAAPVISETHHSGVHDTDATLRASLNPENEATTYAFQYVTGDHFQAEGFTGAQSAPVPAASLPAGPKALEVSAHLSGLAPQTTYRYRLHAENGTDATDGETEALTTYSAAQPFAGQCPANEAFRTGEFAPPGQPSATLSDCRAYEQASPVDKNGGSLQALPASTKASVNGDAVTFESAAGIPGGEGSQEFPTYLARRSTGPQSGEGAWSTEGLLPPASLASKAAVLAWTPDFSEVFDYVANPGSGADLLARQGTAGSLTPIAHSDDPEANFSYAGSSADKETVIFGSSIPLTLPPPNPAPTGGGFNLYAWSRDSGEVALAGVLPEGSAPPGGSLAGLVGNSGYTQQQPAVMSDGSVYFTAAGQTYLRENPTAPETTDRGPVDDCIPTPGLACTIHVSASEKTNGGGPGGTDTAGTAPAEFLAASTDTSKAFFTSSEKLTDDATTGPEPGLAAIVRAKLGGSGIEGSPEESFLPAHASGIVIQGPYIYWADPTTGNIGRATLNGNGAAGEVDPNFLEVGGKPRWVAVDSTYAYWTDAGEEEASGEGTIGRARLDHGEAPKADFITGASQPEGIAVNGTNVYWANDGTAAIARASIDGSSAEPNWHSLGGAYEKPQGMTLDDQHLYWTTSNFGNSFVSSANLDGTEEKITFLGSNTIAPRGIAVDANHIYWVSQGENKIGRIAPGDVGSQCENTPSCEPNFITGTGKGKGLAVDASHLYWSANAEVPPNAGKDLYRYSLNPDSEGHNLTDLAPDSTGENGAEVQGVLGASADGSHVYYVANGVPDGTIANSPNADAESAETGDCRGLAKEMDGECNLYLWSEEGGQAKTTFIARLDPSGGTLGDVLNWVQTLVDVRGDLIVQKTARVSVDGKTLLFRSKRRLTGYDNEGQNELYRFDSVDSTTVCVSCNPTGAPPVGSATLQTIFPPAGGAVVPALTLSRSLSADGNRVFFETLDALVGADTNGDAGCGSWQHRVVRTCQDVYEWEAKGTGSCDSESQNGGCFYLLSTGKGTEPAFFADASASGDDVFIFTADQLVGQDKDELVDVYDVRTGGGIAAQNRVHPAICEGEACAESPPVPRQFQSPPQFSGNPDPTEKPCPKGKLRQKGKCVGKRHRKKKRKKHHHHKAGGKGR